jgi:hypothetical protein
MYGRGGRGERADRPPDLGSVLAKAAALQVGHATRRTPAAQERTIDGVVDT